MPLANVMERTVLPDIPILRNVNCGVFSSYLTTSGAKFVELCGACQEDDHGLTTITCKPYCEGCNNNKTACTTVHELLVFSEHQLTYVSCRTITGGPVLCLTARSPAQFDSFADPRLFSCEGTVDGVACASCSMTDCGLGLNGLYTWTDVTYLGDCTNVDQVSKVNDCDETGTGVFAHLYNGDFDPATCPQGGVVPLIRAPAPVGTPITIVAQPQAPTAIAPVLPPTAAPATSPSAPVTTTVLVVLLVVIAAAIGLGVYYYYCCYKTWKSR
jgi:hypothetical protein